MDYEQARLRYDGALDALRAASEKFDGLFPPRNTPIHLKTPGLNHDHLRSFRQELDQAMAAYSAAVSDLTEVALRECPDVLISMGPVQEAE